MIRHLRIYVDDQTQALAGALALIDAGQRPALMGSDGRIVTGRVRSAFADGNNALLLGVDEDAPARCPRCGHDTPDDPSRRLDGDHLVIHETPLRLDVEPGNTTVTYRASADVRVAWCSTSRDPDAAPPH